LSLINSTVSSNTSAFSGGGIYNHSLGDIYLYNSTLTNNTSDFDNNGSGDGGAIYNHEGGGVRGLAVGYVETSNSIIAGNFDSPNNAGTGNIHPNVSGGDSVGNNNNLISSLAGTKGTLGTGTDIVANPLLSPLQNNGRPTQTHALLPGSPAINAGDNSLVPLDTNDLDGDENTIEAIPFDQRGTGFSRIIGGTVDIGALEVQENSFSPTQLNTTLNRFRNKFVGGTYLFANQAESESIIANFSDTFALEGEAFKVSSEPADGLVRFNRFANLQVAGTYLFANEGESVSIRQNFGNVFREEGTAFYAYDADAGLGTDYYRLANTQVAGTYIFVNEAEKDQIVASFPQFTLEGIAFEVGA
jgi:hypothetical protein